LSVGQSFLQPTMTPHLWAISAQPFELDLWLTRSSSVWTLIGDNEAICHELPPRDSPRRLQSLLPGHCTSGRFKASGDKESRLHVWRGTGIPITKQ